MEWNEKDKKKKKIISPRKKIQKNLTTLTSGYIHYLNKLLLLFNTQNKYTPKEKKKKKFPPTKKKKISSIFPNNLLHGRYQVNLIEYLIYHSHLKSYWIL